QPTGEPEAVPGSHEPLDDGALRGRAECPRCGGLDQAYRGFSTALKPAHEPVIVARKPLAEKTVARNVLAHGTGAINIDATRINGTSGRWPANVLLDHNAAAWVDEQSGVTTSPPVGSRTMTKPRKSGSMAGALNNPAEGMANGHGDSGGASRFFYTAKAPKRDRKSTRLNSSHVSISYAVFC